MTSNTPPRIIMLPGMAADARLFTPQRDGGLVFEAPTMPIPEKREDLPAFAARLVNLFAVTPATVIVGASFGGMVAVEMAAAAPLRAVILVGSCRRPDGLAGWARTLSAAARLVPANVVHALARTQMHRLTRSEPLGASQAHLVHAMCADTPATYLRRTALMIAGWQTPRPARCPVFQIHGTADRLMPAARVTPDALVRGGGHLINLTHADQVNRFIVARAGPA